MGSAFEVQHAAQSARRKATGWRGGDNPVTRSRRLTKPSIVRWMSLLALSFGPIAWAAVLNFTGWLVSGRFLGVLPLDFFEPETMLFIPLTG